MSQWVWAPSIKLSPSRRQAVRGRRGLDPRSLHLEIVPQGNDPRRHHMCFGVPEYLDHSGPLNGGLARDQHDPRAFGGF